MPENLVGGGLFILVTAALWLIYLMPNWAKRREYLATERNALRLQQTLRVLAETSEVPEEVRLAVSSRSVNRQEQLVIEQHKKERAAMKTQRAANARALEAQLRQAEYAVNRQQYRIRRSRVISTGIAILSLISIVIGVVLFQAASVAGVWLLLTGLLFGLGSVLVLRQLAVVSLRLKKQRQEFSPSYARRHGTKQRIDVLGSEATPAQSSSSRDRSWQPQPLPQPLYLSRQLPVASNANHVDHQAGILAEVEKAKARIRNAHTQVPAIPLQARENVGSYLSEETRALLQSSGTALSDQAGQTSAEQSSAEQSSVEREAREIRAIRKATREAQAARIAASTSAASATSGSTTSDSAQQSTDRAAKHASPYQAMGVVSSEQIQRPDFDAAIRRRRAG